MSRPSSELKTSRNREIRFNLEAATVTVFTRSQFVSRTRGTEVGPLYVIETESACCVNVQKTEVIPKSSICPSCHQDRFMSKLSENCRFFGHFSIFRNATQ